MQCLISDTVLQFTMQCYNVVDNAMTLYMVSYLLYSVL